MHSTGAVRQANVGDDPELVDRKVAPALEVVTHSGLNGNPSFAAKRAGDAFFDSWMLEQLHNHLACGAPRFAASMYLANSTDAARQSSQVII